MLPLVMLRCSPFTFWQSHCISACRPVHLIVLSYRPIHATPFHATACRRSLRVLGSATPSFTHDTRDEQTRPKNKISPPVIPSALHHAALHRGTRHGA